MINLYIYIYCDLHRAWMALSRVDIRFEIGLLE
jgi:hypothetical protein